MATIDLKNKKEDELVKDMNEAAAELRKARFNVAGTKGLRSKAPMLRKQIARIKTELGRRLRENA